ncbi:uncharacterized protein LOC125111927 [Phacochoerus africanus]|uniref:uncharacterized protein LOC125111927 n=1 Tax=Phacochoerus africanus TaxID=41426 RepID=UPI001FDA05E0|nr:uncharacterized protein LOC125111927 [Phacochoerus africanus]
MKGREEKEGASSLGFCVCQLLLSASKKLCFQLTGTTYPGNLSTWDQNPLGGLFGKMNWTNETTTTMKPGVDPKGLSGLGPTATVLSGSIGVIALILLLMGLMSMPLKKWRHERLFKKQLKHQMNYLHKSSEFSCHADAIYSNVINLAPRKEEDFAVYANVPPFNRPRRTSPDQVEYASIVFH